MLKGRTCKKIKLLKKSMPKKVRVIPGKPVEPMTRTWDWDKSIERKVKKIMDINPNKHNVEKKSILKN